MNKKRVLLMDEVDGMAGNEDRGGVAELINLIKITKVIMSLNLPPLLSSNQGCGSNSELVQSNWTVAFII